MQGMIGKLTTVAMLAMGAFGLGCSAKASAKVKAGTPEKTMNEPAPVVEAPPPRKRPSAEAIAAGMKRTRARLKGDRIEIDEKVHFAFDKADIEPDSYALLDDVVVVLNENPTLKCEVAGHTDSQGKAKHNKQLSQQRAESVKIYLVNKGISRERLEAMGYGPEQPIAENATTEGQEQNRRVEFRVKR